MKIKRTVTARLEKNTIRPDDGSNCWVWTAYTTRDGHGNIQMDGRKQQVHRVAYKEFINADITSEQVVRHNCDNPPCWNPEHLLLGSHGSNAGDRKHRGRNGDTSNRLTEDQVRAIRAERVTGAKYKDLAEKYSVDYSTIGLIVRRATWVDLM